MISLNIEKTLGFISKENVFAYEAQVKAAQEALELSLIHIFILKIIHQRQRSKKDSIASLSTK